MRFAGQLPFDVTGFPRAAVIQKYQALLGPRYVPPGVHAALDWSHDSLISLTCPEMPESWYSQVKKTRKQPDTTNTARPTAPKRTRMMAPESNTIDIDISAHRAPLGTKWDAENWSCAFDSTFALLYNLFSRDGVSLIGVCAASALHDMLYRGFTEVADQIRTLDNVRDEVRDLLSAGSPSHFPRYGRQMSNLDVLISLLFASDRRITDNAGTCDSCRAANPVAFTKPESVVTVVSPERLSSSSVSMSQLETQSLLQDIYGCGPPSNCNQCGAETMFSSTTEDTAPPFAVLELPQMDIMSISRLRINYSVQIDNCTWLLCGIIMFNGSHFTLRYIDREKRVWYNDSAVEGRAFVFEGTSMNMESLLSHRGGFYACIVVYRSI